MSCMVKTCRDEAASRGKIALTRCRTSALRGGSAPRQSPTVISFGTTRSGCYDGPAGGLGLPDDCAGRIGRPAALQIVPT